MNIRDIARLANVTPGTVSKVLNNYPDISEATRQHVLQIIKENQYTTKNGGRKFKQAVTPRIGLVSENVYNWVSETMQNLLSERFHNADYTVLSFQDNYFSQNKNDNKVAFCNRHKNKELSKLRAASPNQHIISPYHPVNKRVKKRITPLIQLQQPQYRRKK